MTPEVAYWIAGAAALPLLGWGIQITWWIRQVVSNTKRLLKMLEQPDDHGFGTGKMGVVIEDNTRAMKALTNYVRWLAQKQTGETPPPPLSE